MSLSETGGTPRTKPRLATRRVVGTTVVVTGLALAILLHRTIDEITP